MDQDIMGEELSYWEMTKLFFRDKWEKFVWRAMPGTEVRVENKEGTIIVEYGHPRWYDVGASKVEVYSDDPYDHYGPWLKENVGREYIDWQMQRHIKGYWDNDTDIQLDDYVIIKVRDPQWATVVGLAFK